VTTYQSWLLILDNADDPGFDYQIYFPPANHGAVLMTSRVTECKQYSADAFEALGGLEEEDSKELLLKAAELAPGSWLAYDNQAREVARLLGSHTLALIQAGAYISQGHCQLYQYPEVYQRQRQRLLKYRPKQAQSRYRDVYATFEASADVLEQSQTESARDALCLLQILSLFNSSVLPFQIFEEAWKGCRKISQASDDDRRIDEFSRDHVLQLPKFMVPDEDKWDDFRLTEASSLLASLSLATRQDLNGCVGLSMHPLTHAWAKDRQDSKRQGVAWISTGCVLGFSCSDTRMWQTQGRRLLPHVLSYLDLKVKKAFDLASKTVITSILLKCGWILAGMRQDTRLGQLLEDMFLELRQKPDKPSEDFLPLYDLQARSLINLKRDEAARELLEQVIMIKETTQPKTHPDTLTTMSNLAVVLENQGKYVDAEAMNRQTLEIKEEVLGKTHPGTLITMSNLALVLNNQGKYADAEAMNRQTLEIMEEVFGKTHLETLVTMSNLALVLNRQGKYANAEAINRQTLEIEEEVLGKTHPSTLTTMSNLASVLYEQGKYADAEAINRQTLEIREEVLGKTHPDTLTTMSNLALVLNYQGKYANAEAMNRQTLEISEEVLGKTHPDTLTTMSNLALVLNYQGKYADAEALNRHTLEIKEEVLGKMHHDTLTSVYNLAYLLQKKQEYEEASLLYQRACTGYNLVLGSEHPTTKSCMKNYSIMRCSLQESNGI
jgi:tetratricopeptide (TPR) repeat protein